MRQHLLRREIRLERFLMPVHPPVTVPPEKPHETQQVRVRRLLFHLVKHRKSLSALTAVMKYGRKPIAGMAGGFIVPGARQATLKATAGSGRILAEQVDDSQLKKGSGIGGLFNGLDEALGVPVTLENDGNAAAFGEHWMGGGDNLVLLTLGTGVGAGVIIDGRVLHGHFDNAAELGHMIVAADGPPCTCGQRGCLETFASVSGMARRIVAAMADGEQSVMDGSAVGNINGVGIVEAARSGDVLCRRVWEEACRYLAIACINIQHIYNPQRILLAGGLSLAGAYLLEPIRSQVQRRRWNMYEDLPEIALSPLGEDAGLVGAGGLAWKTSAAAASAESRP